MVSRTNSSGLKPKIYSYIRFSTPEQSMGDSERRQLESAKQFAKKRPSLPLDESLKLIDRGKSAFRGTNRKEGFLGKFLEMVREGRIASGSILLVENIDRLSREDPLSALETVTSLIKSGITICSLTPEGEYSRESVANGSIYSLIGQIVAAHESSKLKSIRVTQARDTARRKARSEGRIITKQVPAWLTVVDGHFLVIKEAAAAVKTIFAWRLKDISPREIARRLNAGAWWQPPPITTKQNAIRKGGNGWRASYVKKILTNRAVLGEYQPHKLDKHGKRKPDGEPPKPDYFPQIVKPAVFHAVQQRLAANTRTNSKGVKQGRGGRTGKARNLLTSLVHCPYCGGTMTYQHKGPLPKGGTYFYCDNALRRRTLDGLPICEKNGVRYEELIDLILANCASLRPELVLPNSSESVERCKALRQMRDGCAGEIGEIERKLANLTDRVADAPSKSIANRVFAEMKSLEERRASREADLRAADAELDSLQSSSEAFSAWKDRLRELRLEIAKEDPSVRLMLRAHLREFIVRIEVFGRGHRHEYDPDAAHQAIKKVRDELPGYTRGNKVYGGIPALHPTVIAARDGDQLAYRLYDNADAKQMRSKKFSRFVAYAMERRMSKEGRFYRVHFNTGYWIDLVPPGSIADGWKLKEGRKSDDWQHISPDVSFLYEQFDSEEKAGKLQASS
jgi:DNA invertase Pin-like site-specific DNA recombinase